MKKQMGAHLALLVVAALLWAAADVPVAGAHHSAAAFEKGKTVTVSGVVTRFEWSNPHVYIYLMQTTATGGRVEWQVEGSPPSILSRLGWSRDTLRAGESITVTGNPSRNPGSKSLLPASIKRADETLFDRKSESTRLARVEGGAKLPATGLEGTWVTVLDVAVVEKVEDTDKLAVTSDGRAALKAFDEKTMHPGSRCIPMPAPAFMMAPDLKRITQGAGVIRIDGAFDGAQRTVHMDVVTHEGAAPSVQGHSIGRWEGRSLVIDTALFAPHLMGNGYGLPSGSRKHLLERLTPNTDGMSLTYHFELSDPQFLAAPVSGDLRWVYRPDLQYAAEKCDPVNARRYIND